MATPSKTAPRKRAKADKPAPTATDVHPTTVAPIAETASSRPDPKGKLGAVIGLLRRPDGAQITELMATTGWQAHSVRGAISGAIKKKLGLIVTSDKTEAGRVYRIAPGAPAAPSAPEAAA
jgi:hypothetical protein